MPSAARGSNLLDKEFTIINPFREIATHESMVAQSCTTERLPAVLADRFRPQRSYFLSMPRNPLDRTGVHDGDWVALCADAEPCDGKIVVARLDSEVTLQRYRRVDEETADLRPESHNDAHAPRSIDGYVVGALMGRMFACAARQTRAPEHRAQLARPVNVDTSSESPSWWHGGATRSATRRLRAALAPSARETGEVGCPENTRTRDSTKQIAAEKRPTRSDNVRSVQARPRRPWNDR